MEFKQCPRCRCMKNIRKNREICKRCENNFELSDKSKKELAEIEKEIRRDMTDEHWELWKTTKGILPVDEYLRLEKEAGNDIIARHPSKAQQRWEVMDEQAKEFINNIPPFVRGIETELFFKGIRQTEYRRGRIDALKEVKKSFEKSYHHCEDCFNTTKKESIKDDLHQRMDELCLTYGSIFSVGVNEAKEILSNCQHIKSRGKKEDESLQDVVNMGSFDKYSGIAENKPNTTEDKN